MPRNWNLTTKRTFSEAFDVKIAETEAALRQRRAEMDKAWDDLDALSKALKKRMVEVGITNPSGSEEEMLRFNVGGAQFHIVRSALEGRGHLGKLFEGVWDERVPRDADGFIFLDFSPKCVKYVIHALLRSASGTASGEAPAALRNVLPDDEHSYLRYVAPALGLAELLPISSLLEPDEVGPMSATLLGWCPGQPSGLELVYRASRDGWAARAFNARCGDDSPSTITLYRVSDPGRGASGDSVVGGFSSVPWTPGRRPSSRSSPGAFIFMLKDGTRTGSTPFQPVKWGIDRERRVDEVFCGSPLGPWFGAEDLGMMYGSSSRAPDKIQTNNFDYRIPDDSPFLSLDGHDVVEIETFRVCYGPTASSSSKPGLIKVPTFGATATLTDGGRDEDIRSFGVYIAESLMEEKMALHQAHKKFVEANAKAAVSLNALAAVYGPKVAPDEKDAIIELSVRGKRMTTLRSTLQACPNSALATQFDEEKWPATEKDLDERGRRVINCSPSVFSKVLDVLRMRKRETWPAATGFDEGDVRVEVKASDRAAFEELVDMYFPGCESFIMDYIGYSHEES